MSAASPPLRFLGLLLGGWVCLRAVVLTPAWWARQAEAGEGEAPSTLISTPSSARPAPPPSPQAKPKDVLDGYEPLAEAIGHARRGAPSPASPTAQPPAAPLGTGDRWSLAPASSPATAAAVSLPAPIARPASSTAASAHRWSSFAWLFGRRGAGTPFVPGGTLGGSQAGARITYRVNSNPLRPMALSARIYTPLRQRRAAEAALGLDWKPLHKLPFHLLAERREALGADGRSAFSLTGHGGVSELRLGPLRFDAYGQAGLVGRKSRDLFADGSARLSLPLDPSGKLKLGIGAWAAAQPRVSRVDAGPQLSWRLPAAGKDFIVYADWRFRLRGNAEPGSGPAITIATSF